MEINKHEHYEPPFILTEEVTVEAGMSGSGDIRQFGTDDSYQGFEWE